MIQKMRLTALEEIGERRYRYATFSPGGESANIRLPVTDFDGLIIGVEYAFELRQVKAK